MAEREQSQGFYEMLWDCEHCGTKALLAKSQRHCAECGAPQNPDKRYFPKEGEEKKIDGHRYEGSDRVCPNCSTPASAAGKNCTNCGAPLDGSKLVNKVVEPPKPKKATPLWVKILVVAILVAVIVLVWRSCRTKEAKMKVTGHKWARSIAVERFVEDSEEKFKEEVPSDAERVSCRTAPHPTKTVVDENNCKMENVDKGDGTFEKIKKCANKPADGELCSYFIKRWKADKPVVSSGTDMNPVDPPDKDLPPPEAAATINATRRRGKTETYTLVFGDQTCDVSEKVWRKYADGQEIKLKVRASSGAIVCGDIE